MSEEKTENPDTGNEEEVSAVPSAMDPVRKWTLIVIGICGVLIVWHLIADRHTPFTSQARVHALVVPIAGQVSATVTDVFVSNNQFVEAGEELFRIDPDQFRFAVETAEANLQSARQATGASAANINAAEAAVGAATAGLTRAEQDVVRMRGIMEEDPGAISVRRLQAAEASYAIAKQQVEGARANLVKAREDFGDEGEQNVRILQAQAALSQARLDLERTSVLAPTDGLVTDVRVDRGNFAATGAPQMTFLAVHNIWVQADFTENNLGNIEPGSEVEILFDALPGRVFKGKIRNIGFGVAIDTAALGALPTIDNNRQWLRDAQRFPVVIDIDGLGSGNLAGVRVGSQSSVMVYTGDSWILNSIAWIQIRVASILSYAY
jgi:multidrug resistance efflux pump